MEATSEKFVRVIADLTRTRYGMERSVVKLLRRYCDGNGVDKSTLTVVASDFQRHCVSPEFDGVTTFVEPRDARTTIMGLVQSVKEDGLIRLLSYGRDVLELEREDARIKSLSFGRYRTMSNSSTEQQRVGAVQAPVSEVVSSVVGDKPTDSVDSGTPEPPVEEPKKPVYRSEVFQGILIKRRLGPFPDHRPLIYDAVEKLITAGTEVRVSELLQRAVADAKTAATERNKAAGREPRVDDRLWAGISKFSEQLFLEAKVLIGPEGEALGTDWRSRSLPVHSLAPNWRAVCDGLLILGLVDEGENISSVEAKNIARAIYHSSSEESENRVNDAVLNLLERGILEEAPEGLRRVQRSNEARMAPRLVS
jgi:hypothetical protein